MPLGMSEREVIERLRAAQEAASGLANGTAYVQAMDLRWVLAKLDPPDGSPEMARPDGADGRKWVTATLLQIKDNGTHALYMERTRSGHWQYLITRGSKEVGCGMVMIDPAECERLGLAAYDEVMS